MKILAWTLLFFGVSWSAFAGTPISFVQLTDPHIFDDKVDNISGNKQVLRWCIDQINYRFDTEKSYNFVVLTGDLGLEGLAKKNIDGKKTLDDEQLNAAALELAGIIVRSKVKLWLFVPGNNDLLDEDPGTIDRYHFFIKALQTDTQSIMSVVDLCKPGGDSLSGPRDVGTCRFIVYRVR
jgi:Calcineurin-like phosphoesterase